MPRQRSPNRPPVGGGLAVALGAVALAATLSACDARADLVDYFGFEPAPPGTTPALTAAPSSTPIPSASLSLPSPSPSPSPPPALSPTPSATATNSSPSLPPSPTRPPNLALFPVLRERATVVEYDRLLARPGAYVDTLLYFDGRVQRVTSEGGGRNRARIRVAGGDFIHLVYDDATYWGQPLVQGDRIRVVGYLVGLSDRERDGERVPVIEVFDLLLRFT